MRVVFDTNVLVSALVFQYKLTSSLVNEPREQLTCSPGVRDVAPRELNSVLSEFHVKSDQLRKSASSSSSSSMSIGFTLASASTPYTGSR